MTWQVLLAHAEGEENLVEPIADALGRAGYSVAHRGTVLVGESVVAEASRVLQLHGPVVLCGTIRALGTGWAHRLVNAARATGNRIYALQMEREAHLDPLTLDDRISRYWENPENALVELITSIRAHYPPTKQWYETIKNEDLRKCVRADVVQFLVDMGLTGLEDAPFIIERTSLLDRIRRAVTESSLVIVEGRGGNGKSTLLGQLALEWAKESFAAGKRAVDLREHWPSRCISKWRNVPREQWVDEDVDVALLWLPPIRATSPVALFALDGLDEAELTYSTVRGLVREFCDLPLELRSRATLIVTCRDAQEIDYLTSLRDDRCTKVDVDSFTVIEVENSLESGKVPLNEHVRTALLTALHKAKMMPNDALPAPGHMDLDTSASTFETVGSRVKRPEPDKMISRENLDSLLHPAIWKYFCSSSLDDEVRLRVLMDDDEAWLQLARNVVEWFGHTCQMRTEGRPPNLPGEAIRVLLAVAHRCPDSKEQYKKQQWYSTAEAAGVAGRRPFEVFRHAVTAGLIDGNLNELASSNWRWRHAFLPRYLSAQAQEGL